jgi:hypothetical protein
MSTIAILAPVRADFTLGQNQPNYPFTVQNFDPHVPGVIGYVWPGGGENTYDGAPTAVTPLLSPGYVAPYPSNAVSKSAGWTQNVEQLDGDEYAPSGAIIAGSTGDLIFAINATAQQWTVGSTTCRSAPADVNPCTFNTFYIAIPPEFKVTNTPEQVVTTITNNYANILSYKANPFDRYVPNYTLIRVIADAQNQIHFYNGQDEWYYVRINGVTAPTVAGKYFFKMYLSDNAAIANGAGGTSNTQSSISSALPLTDPITPTGFIPTQNWPVLLVKGELDPAIITGTIRYGGYNSSLYGQPIMEAGEVWAQMVTKLDPYTGAQLTGPLTNAAGYFNGTMGTLASPGLGSDGHYEIEGVAPGIYNLYASAAGYPTALIASNVQVLKGQSLHFDGYLNPGPVIHGTVFSKHSFGSEPWPFTTDTGQYSGNSLCYTAGCGVGREYIKIELYNAPTVNNVPSSNSSLVTWSPLPCVAGGQAAYVAGLTANACGDPRAASTIAFPYHDSPQGAGAVFQGPTSSADPQGVGPAQNWYVVANGVNDQFSYEFGSKGEYGAPAQLSGQVPQVYATWVNGLTPGRYYARAWVFRYVQTALDGSTFQEYSFQVTPNEWAGDVSLPMDLRISSWVNKTVHFHDNAGTLTTDPISTGASVLVGTLTGATSGVLYSYNQTLLTSTKSGVYDGNGNAFITFYGFNDTWLGENYGIPAGTYKPWVSALGYIQQTQDLVSVTLSGTPIDISNHLYRGVGFNFTVYSIDWEQPRVNRNWVWPDKGISIGIYDSKYNYTNTACQDCVGDESGVLGGESGGVTNPYFSQTANTYYEELTGTGTGNAHGVWFGQEVAYYAGDYDEGSIAATGLPQPRGTGASVGGHMSKEDAFTVGSATNDWNGLFTSSGLYPTAMDSGQYHFLGWTYGYIQDKDYTVYANKGQIADMKINLLIGVNLTLDILFKKEGLISNTPYNMSARVRFFDDSGNLVATWMSSEGVYVTGTGRATAADNSASYPICDGGVGDSACSQHNLNYVPGGVNLLHVNTAGLPPYGAYGDPVFTPGSGDFEVDNWPASYWSVAKAHFPNEGVLGQPDYTGTGWTAEVDFVNWYMNDTTTPQDPVAVGLLPSQTLFPGSSITGYYSNYYPVVPGLLMGESYHIIPGTAAKSGISFTEDGALNPYYLGHSMVANHLGPYSQLGVWTLGPAHLSGETSAIYEVDLNGYVSGTALAFTWSNELRAISWYTVNIQGAGNSTFKASSYTEDGVYEFYLLPGSYSMTISGPGYKATPLGTISVTSGQSSTPGSGNNVGLPQTNIPVPEFSGIAVVAFSALAASLYLLRRRHQ